MRTPDIAPRTLALSTLVAGVGALLSAAGLLLAPATFRALNPLAAAVATASVLVYPVLAVGLTRSFRTEGFPPAPVHADRLAALSGGTLVALVVGFLLSLTERSPFGAVGDAAYLVGMVALTGVAVAVLVGERRTAG